MPTPSWVETTYTSAFTSGSSSTIPTTNTPFLTVIRQPAGADDNVVFTTQPVVQVNPVAANVTVTAALGSGSGSIGGTLTALTDSTGKATFTNLKIDATSPPSAFTVTFTAAGYTSATSSSFTVNAVSQAVVPLLDDNFSSYANTAALTSKYSITVDYGTFDSYALDTTTGFSGSTKSLKVTYGARGTLGSTTLSANRTAGATSFAVNSITNFANGDLIRIGTYPNYDYLTVNTASAGTITTTTGAVYAHNSGEALVETGVNPRVQVSYSLVGTGSWQTRRELWIEVVAKFDPTWKTDWLGPNSADHKFLLAHPSTVASTGNATGRYSLKLGVRDVADGGPNIYQSAYRSGFTDEMYYEQSHTAANVTPWDGNWHTYRMHVRFNPTTGEHWNRVWVDGILWHTLSGTGYTPMSSECFSWIDFGSNLNDQPTSTVNMWLGRTRVYDVDPGWTDNFTNAPNTAGWQTLVTWSPQYALDLNNPYVYTADGLRDEHAGQAEWGGLTSLVSVPQCPGGQMYRATYPQYFWGVELNYTRAGSAPYYRPMHYLVPVTAGQTHIVANFARNISQTRADALNLNNGWGRGPMQIAPNPGVYPYWDGWINPVCYTNRVEFDLSTPVLANGYLLLGLGTWPQEPCLVEGTPWTWDRTKNTKGLYVGAYFKTSAGFNHNANVGTKIFYLYCDGIAPSSIVNPAIFGNEAKDTYSNSTKGFFKWSNQFDHSGYNEANFTPVGADNGIDINDGNVHLLEWMGLWETNPGVSGDGVERTWVDGQLTDTKTGNFWCTHATNGVGFSMIKWYPIYGGGYAPVPSVQYQFIGPMLVRGLS